jgi:hypothetical protein
MTVAGFPTTFKPRDEAAAWRRHAPALAEWAWSLVNRTDVWGGYYAARDECDGSWHTEQTTHPRRADRGRVLLAPRVLVRHFSARCTDDVVGLHSTSTSNTSRWVAPDIDRHGDHSPSPAVTLAAALGWYGRLRRRGFRPLLEDSNGAGGFHLWTIFSTPIPTALAYAFVRWLVGDYATHGMTAAPECFPKQPAVALGHFGNWLRLPGRHHTRPHWSKVWNGSRWLEGSAAVAFILALDGNDPGLIPAEVAPEPPPPQSRQGGLPSRACVGNLARRIHARMRTLPHRREGTGRNNVAYAFGCWLARDLGLGDAVALEWLSLWDRGNHPPLGPECLAEILSNARQYGTHAVGSGLFRRG